MIRAALAGMFLMLVLVFAPTSAHALEIDAAPMSEAELSETRGGMMLPTGIEANFGAVASTFADGELLLQTHITWDDQGAHTQQLIGSDALIPSDVLPGGLMLRDANGSTTFAHQLDADGLRNILLNDATGRDIRVDTQLQIILPDFSIMQDSMRDSLLALHMFDDLGASPR